MVAACLACGRGMGVLRLFFVVASLLARLRYLITYRPIQETWPGLVVRLP